MRWKLRRVAVVTSPAQKSHSSAFLPTLRPHHGPRERPPRDSSEAASGPRSVTSASTSSTKARRRRPNRAIWP